MNVGGAVAWFFIVAIILFLLLFYGLKITWPSALALAVLVGLIVMNTLAIPDIAFGPQDSGAWGFGLINFIGVIIVLIYLVFKALTDKRA